jgi:hypothetical protein
MVAPLADAGTILKGGAARAVRSVTLVQKIFRIEPHSPGCYGLRDMSRRRVRTRELDLLVVLAALDKLTNGHPKVQEILEAIR